MKCVDLTSFNPLNEACLLSDGELKVKMKAPVRIKLKGQAFKINETLTSLPAYGHISRLQKTGYHNLKTVVENVI